jgi:curved DNA-binding protein CbpA
LNYEKETDVMDYYEILGVTKNASADQIREAYRKKSKKYHPDAGGDDWVFIQVEQAYKKLIAAKGGDQRESTQSGDSTASSSRKTYNKGPGEKSTTEEDIRGSSTDENQTDSGAENVVASLIGSAAIGCFIGAAMASVIGLSSIECGALGAIFGGIGGGITSVKSLVIQSNNQNRR